VRYGAEVTYTVDVATDVRFTVAKVEARRRSRGRCVRSAKANHSQLCSRLAVLPGSFTRVGNAGFNRFRFRGRVGGRTLAVGRYRLISTPMTNGRSGQAASVAFQIVR
jgi:hypothetical protein